MGGADPITWGAILTFIAIVGAGAKLYHSLRKEVEDGKAQTRVVENNLSSYKLTVAETYISKKDLQGSLAPLMDHVSTVKEGVDKLGNRLDRFMEAQAQQPARRARTQT